MNRTGRLGIALCYTLLVLFDKARGLTKVADMNLAMLELKPALISGDALHNSEKHDWPEMLRAVGVASAWEERRCQYLGLIYSVLAQNERAFQAWKSSKGSVDFLIGLGDYYRSEGRLAETEVMYDLASDVDANNSRVLYRWGMYYYQLGEREKARDFFYAALLNNNFHGSVRELMDCNYQLGEILAWYRNWQEAGVYFERAVALRPDNSRYRISLAKALYYGTGDADGAVEQLDYAIRLDPADIWPHLVLSDIYMRAGLYAQAIASAGQAQQISPANSWSYVYRGRVYLKMDDYQLAQRDFALAIAMLFDNADAHCYLGITDFHLQREKDAIAELTLGTQIDPSKKWCYVELGKMYEQIGQTDAAIAEYRTVLILDPQNEEAHRRLIALTTETGD